MKRHRWKLVVGVILILIFLLWTLLIQYVDLQLIGPRGSAVGFATINQYVRNFVGVNMQLYALTDWMGLIPLATSLCFGTLGLRQWIKRKSILAVDMDILALGVFYIVVFAAFLLFEELAINYRPVLINEILEASYPSSTTLLTLCVMPTASLQIVRRVENKQTRITLIVVSVIFTAFMIGARIFAGVHWISDIVGGAILSAGLVMLYSWFIEKR